MSDDSTNPIIWNSIMDRAAIENPDISWGALGLLAEIMKGVESIVHLSDVCALTVDDDITTRATIAELETAGYLVPIPDDSGPVSAWRVVNLVWTVLDPEDRGPKS